MRDRLSGRPSSDSPPLIRRGTDGALDYDAARAKKAKNKKLSTSLGTIPNTDSERSSATGDRRDLSSPDEEYPLKTKYPMVNSMSREIRWFLLDVKDAFERKEVKEIETEDGELVQLFDSKTTLSVVQLRKDLKRLLAASKPLLEAAAAGLDLLLWVNPVATLLLVLVYMYSIWTGYFFALVFKLLLLQLTLNYFKEIHDIDIGLMFLPRKDVNLPKIDMSSGQLVINLAKLAQFAVKFAADVLEKFESLFTWKRPDITWHFYYLCVYWLMWSLCFSIGTCFGACAMTFGIRLFITTYLFNKFPRLRYRLDTYGYFYRNLPVKSGEIEERPKSTDSRSFPSSNSINRRMDDGFRRNLSLDPIIGPYPTNLAHISSTSISDESERESIEEEDMVDDILDHRRCIMVERSPSKVSISGTLHVTQHALLFRSNTGNEERMILLDEINVVRSVTAPAIRTIALFTGSRKCLDVEMYGREKISFIGISRRQELLDTIERVCRERMTRTEFYLS